MGRQPGGCIRSLQSYSPVCVGIYGLSTHQFCIMEQWHTSKDWICNLKPYVGEREIIGNMIMLCFLGGCIFWGCFFFCVCVCGGGGGGGGCFVFILGLWCMIHLWQVYCLHILQVLFRQVTITHNIHIHMHLSFINTRHGMKYDYGCWSRDSSHASCT